ncbi:MAG: ATP-binding protein, partial [Bacilli bacterium]
SIYSVANHQHPFGQRPFRAPHHTASAVALVGGGCHFP